MAIVGVYFYYANFWAESGGGESNTAPWTIDLNIPPSSIYAVCGISGYTTFQDGGYGAGATAGVLSYVTQDPQTGVPSQINIPTYQQFVGQVDPMIIPNFLDANVITITFAYNCYADNLLDAEAHFTAFVWG